MQQEAQALSLLSSSAEDFLSGRKTLRESVKSVLEYVVPAAQGYETRSGGVATARTLTKLAGSSSGRLTQIAQGAERREQAVPSRLAYRPRPVAGAQGASSEFNLSHVFSGDPERRQRAPGAPEAGNVASSALRGVSDVARAELLRRHQAKTAGRPAQQVGGWGNAPTAPAAGGAAQHTVGRPAVFGQTAQGAGFGQTRPGAVMRPEAPRVAAAPAAQPTAATSPSAMWQQRRVGAGALAGR